MEVHSTEVTELTAMDSVERRCFELPLPPQPPTNVDVELRC